MAENNPPAGGWDVAVIGGGPAGMMAAGRAAESGATVVLLEKNATLGKKLLITGGGRCNVTNAEPDTRKLLQKYKKGGTFLPSPFSKFDNESATRFFREHGLETEVEAEQRVFPVSDSARDVWNTMVAYVQKGGVTILSKSPVAKLAFDSKSVTAIVLKDDTEIRAKKVILATGGISHPETGSTGDGFKWLKALGHTVSDTNAALVPIALKETWPRQAAGVALKDVKITAYLDGKKQESCTGKILITHVGLSGPGILNFSRAIGEMLSYGTVELELDLRASEGPEKVNARLQDLFKTDSNKMLKNMLGRIIPPALVAPLLKHAGIDGATFCNSVTRADRLKLAHLLKHVHVTVKELLGLDKAVITAGGVALEEIDWKTMRSLKYDNLYIVGDLLDIDRPSGGYSLQLCWTTGFVAGTHAAN